MSRDIRSLNYHRTKKLAFVVLGFIAFFLFGALVMTLWNWLMPAIFGLRTVSYFQAIGLLVLSRILFGGFRGGHHGRGPRWARMSPEEREKFREAMRQRVCRPDSAGQRPGDASAEKV